MKPKAEKPATGSSSRSAGGTHANEGTAIYEELLEYYNSKIDALRQTRDALEATKPILTLPSTPPADDDGDHETAVRQQQQRNRVFVSLELLADMVDEMAIDIVFETFFEARRGVGVYTMSNTSCDCDGAAGAVSVAENADSDTHSSQGNGADLFECPSCERSFPAARFASHMDKCMGLSSRRTATRRSKANSAGSTPGQAAAGYDSSSENSTADRKRRR
ncbi:hypothetical protein LPJ59_000697 [Coemansia sp. RSA 2399]|nr:hypothetical protein LPJ59_000697 [Coemansia sp. RSA 2399]KAJ1904647.1 hypothetical protein LPJ81_002370 [Coemansia sp. IMI 209127]